MPRRREQDEEYREEAEDCECRAEHSVELKTGGGE